MALLLLRLRIFEIPELRQKLEEAFLPLQYYGVVQEDANLDNFVLVDDGRLSLLIWGASESRSRRMRWIFRRSPR